ncbi:hypothetical protein [Ochrovirga pacifica]|uniref:hypothetical protein n=1 Tax=Ochrovirga pacifica TaxID=1042376 RepID=UPI000255A27D|nr:hypothetical protein [Ochrovirga pacifica]
MKNLIWILAIAFVGTATAQKKSELQGPAAKNYKPWQHNVEATVSVQSVNKSTLKSKDAKNYKPWKKEAKATEKLILASNYNRNKLQGPEAKNYKPWLD